MAPAIAQIHGIEILKISASNFCSTMMRNCKQKSIHNSIGKRFSILKPCVPEIQRFPKTVCGSDGALPLMQLQSWPNRWGDSNISSTAHSDWSRAKSDKLETTLETHNSNTYMEICECGNKSSVSCLEWHFGVFIQNWYIKHEPPQKVLKHGWP